MQMFQKARLFNWTKYDVKRSSFLKQKLVKMVGEIDTRFVRHTIRIKFKRPGVDKTNIILTNTFFHLIKKMLCLSFCFKYLLLVFVADAIKI